MNGAKVTQIEVSVKKDSRGILRACEAEKETSISYKRYFIIKNVKGGKRGGHAHKYTDQIIDCIQGKFILRTVYNNREKIFTLNQDTKPINLPKMTWVEMTEISEDCIILVLSSDSYNMSNSIREFSEYTKYCENE